MRFSVVLCSTWLVACGGDTNTTADATLKLLDASIMDAASPDAMGIADAAPSFDSQTERTTLTPQFCPGTPTIPGLYEGTLALNLNDVSGCGGIAAPGRDGAVRIELAAGATVTATMRHEGDGILYILDNCPVVGSCLDSSDTGTTSAEQVSYTNGTTQTNPIYVILDSHSLAGAQAFELDLAVQ